MRFTSNVCNLSGLILQFAILLMVRIMRVSVVFLLQISEISYNCSWRKALKMIYFFCCTETDGGFGFRWGVRWTSQFHHVRCQNFRECEIQSAIISCFHFSSFF